MHIRRCVRFLLCLDGWARRIFAHSGPVCVARFHGVDVYFSKSSVFSLPSFIFAFAELTTYRKGWIDKKSKVCSCSLARQGSSPPQHKNKKKKYKKEQERRDQSITIWRHHYVKGRCRKGNKRARTHLHTCGDTDLICHEAHHTMRGVWTLHVFTDRKRRRYKRPMCAPMGWSPTLHKNLPLKLKSSI